MSKPKPQASAPVPPPKRRGRWIELMALDAILPAVANPKDHDIGVLHQSVERHGFAETPLLDERTSRLVAGHGRLETLRQLKARGAKPPEGVEVGEDGAWLVPVQRGWRSKDDEAATAYVITANSSSEKGGWHDDLLAEQLTVLATADALQGTGFDGDDVEELLRRVNGDPPATFTHPGEQFQIVLTCESEKHQALLLDRFMAEGLKVRALVG